MLQLKYCRFIIAVFVSFVLLQTQGRAQDKPLKKINWGMTALSAAMWIPWLAKEAKIYQKNGLDVEIVLLRGSGQVSADYVLDPNAPPPAERTGVMQLGTVRSSRHSTVKGEDFGPGRTDARPHCGRAVSDFQVARSDESHMFLSPFRSRSAIH